MFLVKVIGLKVVGVDLLCFNYGLVVIEVNFFFGLEGIEIVIGVDVFGKIIEFLEKNVRKG